MRPLQVGSHTAAGLLGFSLEFGAVGPGGSDDSNQRVILEPGTVAPHYAGHFLQSSE